MPERQNQSDPNELLTPTQAAEFKGVSRTAVYSAIAEKRLPHVRMLGRLAVSKSDLVAWKPVRYAGRSKCFIVSPEVRAKMSQASKRLWEKRKQEQQGSNRKPRKRQS
jgi:excisionase family DNA binding protein